VKPSYPFVIHDIIWSMKAIPREVERKKHITWSREIRDLQDRLKITPKQRDVIIGSILGDACLDANVYGKNYRLQVIQSQKQKAYIDWKFKIFQNWCISEPKFQSRTKSWRFRTVSHPSLTEYRRLFYPEGKKRIPSDIDRILKSPLSLAVWFMDDGTKGPRNGLTLNSQSFTRADNLKLSVCLERNFGLKTSLHKDKIYWRIYILPESILQFTSLVEKFILGDMKYKLFSL